MHNASHTASVLAVMILMATTISASAARRTDNLEVVSDLDLQDYAGTWYEIARLPNRLQKGLVEVTSDFRIDAKGRIQVISRGYKGSRRGRCTTVKADVYIPDPKKTGALKVKAMKIFSLDYKVIDIDRVNYQYALVTSGTMDYLWIVSKSPTMSETDYQNMVESARNKGFAVAKLQLVPQVSNSAVAGR